MIIIVAKNAFLKKRTGVEEYAFQLVKHLAKIEKKEEVVVYTNKIEEKLNLSLNFHLKIIKWPFLWTQIGLSWKILGLRCRNYTLYSTVKLFIPIHVMPLIHPKRTIVTIHGLEYEYFPEYYSWFSRQYLRWSTHYATKHAWKIITVSKNTKRDLIKLYKADPRKIEVIWHGVEKTHNVEHKAEEPGFARTLTEYGNKKQKEKKYFLYLGRIELKKNVLGIIKAFEIFKKKYEDRDQKSYAISYKLMLAGGKGYGYENIKNKISKIEKNVRKDIIFTGYVNDKVKWQLIRNAEALVFPSFYEGFGMPIIEAQSVGTPVITSKGSSMGEITNFKIPNKFQNPILPSRLSSVLPGSSFKSKHQTKNIHSALPVNPNKSEEIAEAMYKIINNKKLRNKIIKRGYKNVKRFSWQKCAKKTLRIIS